MEKYDYDKVGAEFRVAAMDNDVAIMKNILEQYSDFEIDSVDPEIQRTALHWAIITHSEAAIKFLLERGARVDLPDAKGNSPYVLSQTHPMCIENKKTIWVQHVSKNFLATTVSTTAECIAVQTRRGDNSLSFCINHMGKALETCKENFVKVTRGEVQENLVPQQKLCLKKNQECLQKTWQEDIMPILSFIYNCVRMLERGIRYDWIINELLLSLSQGQCLMSRRMAFLEDSITREMDLLPGSADLKKEVLKRVGKINHIIVQAFNTIQKNIEKLSAGNYYKGFFTSAKNYAEAGNLIELQLTCGYKITENMLDMLEQYNREPHLKWYEFLVMELKKHLHVKFTALGLMLQNEPYLLTIQECVVVQESVFQSLRIFLDAQLKLRISETKTLSLQRMFLENNLECATAPIASYIFTYILRLQKATDTIIERALRNGGMPVFPPFSPNEHLKKSLSLDVEETKQESHQDVVRREKQWKREQEAKQRQEQQSRTLLLQQQACSARLAEERKHEVEARHAALKEQLLHKAITSNCVDTFYAILNENMSKKIKWKKLVTLGEGLEISRMEGLTCVFSLFELGAVTFHQGHGKDKCDCADPIGINSLRGLFKLLGFDKETFSQDLPVAKKSAKVF